MKKFLALLFLFPSISFADRLGSLTPNYNVLISSQIGYDHVTGSVTLIGKFSTGGKAIIFDSSVVPLEILSHTSGFGAGTSIDFYTDDGAIKNFGYDSLDAVFGMKSPAGLRQWGVSTNFSSHAPQTRFYDGAGSNYVSFRASGTTTKTEYVLPNAAGTTGQVLSIQGSENNGFETTVPLKWITSSGGGGTPGGSSGQIQYNNSGSFGGFGNWDGNGLTVSSETVQGTVNLSTTVFNDTTSSGAQSLRFEESGFFSGAPQAVFYPNSGTNVGVFMSVIPKGTGYNANLKAALSVYNTDEIFDSANTNFVSLEAEGTFAQIATGSLGTAIPLPLLLSAGAGESINTQQLFLSTNNTVGLNTLNPGAQLEIDANNSTTVGEIVKGASSQSADLQDWNNSSNVVLADISSSGHINSKGGTPSLSACGTSPSVTGSDNAGTVTVGSGVSVTGCTLTFATAYTNAPTCVISDNSVAISGDISSISNSAVSFGFSASLGSGQFYYICMGKD